MDLNQLKYFEVIAKYQNMSRAPSHRSACLKCGPLPSGESAGSQTVQPDKGPSGIK